MVPRDAVRTGGTSRQADMAEAQDMVLAVLAGTLLAMRPDMDSLKVRDTMSRVTVMLRVTVLLKVTAVPRKAMATDSLRSSGVTAKRRQESITKAKDAITTHIVDVDVDVVTEYDSNRGTSTPIKACTFNQTVNRRGRGLIDEV